MIEALQYIGLGVLWLWLFWALYVFTMSVYRAKLAGRLRGINRLFAVPLVLLAVVIDALARLVTARLQRYMAGEDGWRKRAADWLCNAVLDPFDPDGDHC